MTSRYSPNDLVPPVDGLPLRIGRVGQLDGTYNVVYYTTTDGERLDTLAAEFLGDAAMWWAIADLNPDLHTLEEVPPRTRLRVPYVPNASS